MITGASDQREIARKVQNHFETSKNSILSKQTQLKLPSNLKALVMTPHNTSI